MAELMLRPTHPFAGLPLALSLALTLAMGCNRGTSTDSEATQALPIGKPLFPTPPEQITELALAKDDPVSGDRWSASLSRSGDRWTISTAPEGTPLTDREADSKLIIHLLDTLRTLRAAEELKDGQGQGGNQWGLSPPLYWLRWSGQGQSHEIRVGAKANPFQTYAGIQGRYAKVEGAALKMLEYLDGFRKIRHHKLMTWNIDDADRLRVTWTGPRAVQRLEVERNSGEWARPGNRKLTPEAQTAIEALSKLEIDRFEQTGWGRPWVTLEWLSRKNEILRLEIDQNLKARASNRPGAVFALFPEARALLLPGRFIR